MKNKQFNATAAVRILEFLGRRVTAKQARNDMSRNDVFVMAGRLIYLAYQLKTGEVPCPEGPSTKYTRTKCRQELRKAGLWLLRRYLAHREVYVHDLGFIVQWTEVKKLPVEPTPQGSPGTAEITA